MNKWVNGKLDDKKRTGKGFTLIELLVVITVLGILAAIVAFAVQDISGQARTSASGSSQSEVNQAEQQYCAQNGTYGTVAQLVQAGLLTNPNPATTIYVSYIPANAQIYQACSPSSGSSAISTTGGALASGANTAGTVYDVYPQAITQPDGSVANIPAPPNLNNIITVGTLGSTQEILAALGVTPYGGQYQGPYTGANLNTWGPLGVTPLINVANYVQLPGTNYQLIAAAKPSLIVGENGTYLAGQAPSYEAIAPFVSVNQANLSQYPVNPTAGDLSLLWWYQSLVQLGQVLNLQVQAAAFLTAFQNTASSAIAALQGKSVTRVLPQSSAPTTSFELTGLNGPTNGPTEFVAYLGMPVNCPNCAANQAIASGSSYTYSTTQVPAAPALSGASQYLDITPGSTALSSEADMSPSGYLGSTTQVLNNQYWGPNNDGNFGPPVSSTLAGGTAWSPGSGVFSLPAP